MDTQNENSFEVINEDLNLIIAKLVGEVLGAYKELTMQNFFSCLIRLMEAVELIPTLVGEDKKYIVKEVLKQIVNQVNISDKELQQLLVMFVNSFLLDLIIDGIVKLTKEGCKINFQEMIDKFNTCRCQPKCCQLC